MKKEPKRVRRRKKEPNKGRRTKKEKTRGRRTKMGRRTKKEPKKERRTKKETSWSATATRKANQTISEMLLQHQILQRLLILPPKLKAQKREEQVRFLLP